MATNDYQFRTEWYVTAPREVLFDILREAAEFPRWWPEVYLKATSTRSGRSDHIGDRVELLTKGRLPYHLRWTAEVLDLERPEMIEITASGDFVGRGIWHLESQGEQTYITFDWRIRADKPLLRWFSPLLKPIFEWNHRWAMSKGLPRLRQEAARRTDQWSKTETKMENLVARQTS